MSASATSDRVSVVIATYNMGRYLPQAVQSVLEQSYPNVEVQIIDDGSSDDTAEVVQQWGEDVRVRVHRQANAGQARAKNEGHRAQHRRLSSRSWMPTIHGFPAS